MQEIDLKLVTECLKIVGAVVVFGIGLRQYAQAQKWKRREFIAAQIQGFEADKKIQIAMTMLDWNDRKLYFPTETGKDPIAVTVNDVLLCSALLPHEAAHGYFPNEVLIRDCVDRLMEMLVRLANFVDAGLISVEELRPYMDYWMRLVSGHMAGRHSPEVFTLLLNYIQHYSFDGAAHLVAQFGYNPVPPQSAVEQAIRTTLAQRSTAEWCTTSDAATHLPLA